MDVRWRDQDWEPLREEVAEARPAVRATLAASGLLKFFECPLLRAQEHLLHCLIEMWSPRQHCFFVRGERVHFTAEEDIYFLTGLPFRGTSMLSAPVMPRETDLAGFARRFFSGGHYMTGSTVRINALDVLLHRCVASMIVRIYGSTAPHQISGGEMSLMERVVVGRERFSWGLSLHSQMVYSAGPMSVGGPGRVCIWLYPGGLFPREGADVAAEGGAGGTSCATSASEAVV
jgi:hypothetical protein